MKKDKKLDADNEVHFFENLKLFYKLIRRDRVFFFLLIFVALVVEVLMIADNLLVKWVVDYGEKYVSGDYLAQEILTIFSYILFAFLGVVIVRASLRYVQIHLRNKLMSNVDYNVKHKYFNKVVNFDYEFHTTHKSGDLISKLDRGTDAAINLAELTQRVFTPFLSLIVVLVSIAYFDLAPAIITTGTGIIIIIFSWIIFSRQAAVKLNHNNLLDEEKGFVSNVFSNFESIKLFGKEKDINTKYDALIGKSKKGFIGWNNYYRIFNVLMSLSLGIGTVLLFYFSLRSFLAGKISLGTVIFIFTTFGRMITPIVNLSDSLRSLNQSMSDVQTLFSYDKIKNKVNDSHNAKSVSFENGKIEFRNIRFSYGKKKIFDNFNLTIRPKEKVAIVGASGEGKTSLVRLLFRLYDPDSGKILIDGEDIKEIKQDSLRSQLSVVPQEPILFHDSIYNNIKFSNPSASKEEVADVIKMSSTKKIIDKLPLKERTLVGERGIKLSGGEKQRVAIARALLANRKILVLDEPTSSLDLETEYEIQKGIEKVLEGKTAIIIAHRLSTIRNADRIVVLREGRIVEEGKHEELLKKKGEYARLWKYQKRGFVEVASKDE